MKLKTQIIATLLMLLFGAAQATSLHEFSHDDQDVHCELCVVSHDFQSVAFDMQPNLSFEPIPIIPIHQEIISFSAFAKAETLLYSHTTRPPPVGI